MVTANEAWRNDPERRAGARRRYDRRLRELKEVVELTDKALAAAKEWRTELGLDSIHSDLFAANYHAHRWLTLHEDEPNETRIGNMAAFGEYDSE